MNIQKCVILKLHISKFSLKPKSISTTRNGDRIRILGLILLGILGQGCSTHFIEFEGECVIQQWMFASVTMRRRTLCDLPPPDYATEGRLRDREAMSTNPFPDFFDFDNEADTIDPNLLEKSMEYPPSEDDLKQDDDKDADR